MMDLDVLCVTGPDTPAAMSISGKRLSGITSLAQRVVIVLMTRVDELLRQNEGTSIRRDGLYSNSGDDYLSLLLGSALFDVVNIIRGDTESTDPSEILKDACVSSVGTSDDGVSFTINVYNEAGESIEVPANTGV